MNTDGMFDMVQNCTIPKVYNWMTKLVSNHKLYCIDSLDFTSDFRCKTDDIFVASPWTLWLFSNAMSPASRCVLNVLFAEIQVDKEGWRMKVNWEQTLSCRKPSRSYYGTFSRANCLDFKVVLYRVDYKFFSPKHIGGQRWKSTVTCEQTLRCWMSSRYACLTLSWSFRIRSLL